MEKRLKVIIALIVAAVGFLGVFRYGSTSRVEWDVSSGQQRTVTKFLGIPQYGEPRSTLLSEWKGASAGDAEWVEVASSVPRGSYVSWCYFNLLEMDLTTLKSQMNLSAMNGEPLDMKEAKKAVADFILDALRDGTEICDVVAMLRHALMSDRRDLIDRPFTMSELRSLSHKQNRVGGRF